MKHAIGCTIETLTALRLGKINQIRLTDCRQTAVIRSHSLTLTDAAVAITPVWLDAICIAAATPSACPRRGGS